MVPVVNKGYTVVNKGYTVPYLDKGFVRYVDHLGTDQRIVEAARMSYKSPSKGEEKDRKLVDYLFRNRHCYHPDMEVLTSEGWKKWKDCKNEETFIVPDPETKKFRAEKIKVKTFSVESEEMYIYENSRMYYSVTSDHKMLFKSKASPIFQSYKIQNQPKFGHYMGINGFSFDGNKKYDLTTNEMALIGFYLGDGSKNSANTISFHLNKKRKINYLRELLGSINCKYHETSNGKNIRFTVNTPEWFHILVDLNKKAQHKKIEESNLINFTKEQLIGLFDGLNNSDGSFREDRNRYNFSSVSINLIQLYQAVGSLLGFDTHELKRDSIDSVSCHKSNRTSLESRSEYYNKEIYSGNVYCATTSTGWLMVRGNSSSYAFVCGNTSPFEQCSITFNIKMPIFIMRQFVRHRTFRINEQSGRYTKLIDDFYLPVFWRSQDNKNKQGSVENKSLPHTLCRFLVEANCKLSYLIYSILIKLGVAREMARIILPLNIYTEIYVNCDLNNLMHFLSLRLDSHAQKEIQELAQVMHSIMKELYPWTTKSFDSYSMKMIKQNDTKVSLPKKSNGKSE